MKLNTQVNGSSATISVTGRLETMTAPQLESAIKKILPDADDLTLDLAGLEYISSAGLRVLLSSQKAFNKKKGMKLIHACDEVMEVFEVTGFTEILTIE
ncbi:MAG: STAS domain-containing protein [Eubacterium sp.]|uniref:Anti-sigma factor antagonist n=1 Tax=Eubacterium cellulosolvens (strain ATCC 43171 / JCM 9499 / 6) TaxID=633697 RepID=I5ARG8_EUBC6|nr:STAS domain-containing protein [Eubacterium sp.]